MNSNATYTLEELDGGEDDQTIWYAGAEAVRYFSFISPSLMADVADDDAYAIGS